MRKEYSTLLRREFDKLLTNRLPNFSISKGESCAAKGSLVYKCNVAKDFALYIYLYIDELFDEFTVEVGWSTDQKLPALKPFSTPQDTVHDQGTRMRLSRFWDPKSDYWWVIQPRDTPEEAIRRIREFDMSIMDPRN